MTLPRRGLGGVCGIASETKRPCAGRRSRRLPTRCRLRRAACRRGDRLGLHPQILARGRSRARARSLSARLGSDTSRGGSKAASGLARVDLEAAKGVLDGDQAGAWLERCCLDDAKDGSRVSQDELERLIPAFERVFERPSELVNRRPFLAFVLGVEGAQAAGEPADAAPG